MVRNPYRPNCPNCSRELVFAAFVIGSEQFSAWMCDCKDNPQPSDIKRDIVLAREWDQQALVYRITVE